MGTYDQSGDARGVAMGNMEKWRMKDEGQVVEWIPAPNGGHVGIVKGDDGSVVTIKSDDCVDASVIAKGKRIRYVIETFRDDDGERIEGKDTESGEHYCTGAAREVEVV